MGFQFAGKAVYTAVWVAAVSLFMELLGFSTQKWLTAGGLGTVLLTLAGREVQICPFNTLLFMKHTFCFSCMPNNVSFALFPLQIWILLISKPDFCCLSYPDIHKFPLKCNDPCNSAFCCE